MKRKITALLAVLLAALLVLSGCEMLEEGLLPEIVPEKAAPARTETAVPEAEDPAPAAKATARPTAQSPPGPITEPQAIADYLFEYGELPPNFITKKEAQALGWDSSRNYLSDVAPGMSIGGDRFGNYEGILPKVKGRTYYEADCYYTGGKRTAERIVYSSDGHVWYTGDHYRTFTELFPSGTEEGAEGK